MVAGMNRIRAIAIVAAALLVAGAGGSPAQAGGTAGGVDLLNRYPTTMTAGDTAAGRARPWEFSAADMYRLSRFNFDVATIVQVRAGICDLGIGHCADGVVWALVIPRGDGRLTSDAVPGEESVAHVWLRFHPSQIDLLFPPETVSAGDATNLLSLMRGIARHKFRASFHAGENALIPDPGDIVADADIADGPRRFFIVDKNKRVAAYAAAFEGQKFRPPPALTPELATNAFDQLWEEFDSEYAMFALRPEVDWGKLREQYRPQALACRNSDDFAEVCAAMLRPLRDLHISLKLAGTDVPVYDRPRSANANPSAHKAILGSLNSSGTLQWAVTADKIGFVAIYGWDDEDLPEEFGKALEQMRDTRGMIVDVRSNGGGRERLAQLVAGRFVDKPYVYAYDQFRDGPNHTNFTKMAARTLEPVPWRYERPVVLLIGQLCMSSTESFVGMMAGDEKVTTMGDRTCGSSGDPYFFDLPLEMSVAIPRWIDYKADHKPLDENGYQPQIPFKPEPGAFGKGRDDLLSAALARLREGN
jgi:hypothetical protein